MADVVDKETRSQMMRGIRGKNTRPELLVRRGLFSLGFRYRLHDKSLPGRPDIVIKKHRVAILAHGCFWHAHAGCRYFRLPASNPSFWKRKLQGNAVRDRRFVKALSEAGWRVAIVWECALRKDAHAVVSMLHKFIPGTGALIEIGWSEPLRRVVASKRMAAN